MKKTSEVCRDQEKRRRDIRKHLGKAGYLDLNGIDYLEVDESQTILTVYFLGRAPANITEKNVRIDGGKRIQNIKVKRTHHCDPKDPRVDGCIQIEVYEPGDFSTYTLRLVKTNAQGRPGDEPLEGFDPRYAQIDFSFKANCSSDLDCAPQHACPPLQLEEPEISYLAKDYSSFRQLILDRLSLIMPEWKERDVPDVGIALVELLAYTGDYLSYYQDAVATEAYLDTARQRISVRRHLKLVDYHLHEGCNARAWLYIETDDDKPSGVLKDVYFISENKRAFPSILGTDALRDIPFSEYEVFEPVVEEANQPLYQAHNRISFYTWGDRECCLPRGAMSATLKDEWIASEVKPESADSGSSYVYDSEKGQQTRRVSSRAQPQERLAYRPKPARKPPYEDPVPPEPPDKPRARRLKMQVGDVLIFEEVLGPVTGEAADADLTHRHVVRLTKAELDIDPLYDQPVVGIEWANEDALPFSLCISAIGRAPECRYLENISVAHGNVLLVDHGRWVGSNTREPPESWNVPLATEDNAGCWAAGEPRETFLQAGTPLKAQLRLGPVTHRAPFPAPVTVAGQQAKLLLQVMTAVHARLEQLWRKARQGESLSKDDIDELVAIFGREALIDAGLISEYGGEPQQLESDEQAKTLELLLQREDRLLARKARRVRTLATFARAGYVMDEAEEQELAQMFGPNVPIKIGPGNRQLLGAASLALKQDPREALPCVRLLERALQADGTDSAGATSTWLPQADLFASSDRDRDFVAEVDNEGIAHLRFGDGDRGRAPIPGTILTATYRVGNGSRGNVGAEAIKSLVFRNQERSGDSLRVRNPLPAVGGVEPEPLAEAKLFAPATFRQELQRAVTVGDYAQLTMRGSPATVQRAATAPLRWTGSWYEVEVAIDPFGSEQLDQNLREEVEGYLFRYRRIGHDLQVRPASYVSLDIAMTICVLPHYLRAHVKAAVLDLFSNHELPNSQYGFFHPDNLSFGEGIYLSKLVAAAQGVPGVESVRVDRLQRLYEEPNKEIENGILPLGPLEVARLDNDRSFPERGKLMLQVRGGR